MRADKIYVSQFDFLSIKKLEIDQAIGEHATATVSGYISDENTEDYKWKVLEHIWVTISIEDEHGEVKNLMTGVIAGFSFEILSHITKMTLILKSGTYLMDGMTHFRSYQTSGRTYLDVLNFINQPYGHSGVKAESSLETTAYDFLLQYKETDWFFVKRIASSFGLAVTPAINSEGVFYQIGNANHFTYHLPTTVQYRVRKRIDSYMTQGSNSLGSSFEQDYLEYQATMRESFDLWDQLILEGESGYICQIHSEYRQEELFHTYTLRPLNGMRVIKTCNQLQTGCSFQAIVKEVVQDLVKVELIGDENKTQEIRKWFPYSTGYSSPDGPGWYCMPEIGDQVRLQIPSDEEADAYVINSVHRPTDNARKNPEHKSFRTKYGKELLFTPTTMEMTNNQGMSIKITDGEGIAITSCKNISIKAGGDMTISSEDSSLVIAGTESVDIRQSGAGLHMDDEIAFTGGKFRIQ